MRILVTGGAGFIGSAYLNRLVAAHPEHHFYNLDHLGYAANLANLAEIESAPNYTFRHLDLCDFAATSAFLQEVQPDQVVHFAAESHVDRSIASPREFVESNVMGTFHLLQATWEAWKAEPSGKRFHHISTDEVFGALGPTGLFNESTPYDPRSPYSASKAASDHLVRAFGHTYGLPFVVTNCSNNYGPRQFPEKLIPLMILNAIEGKPLPVYGEGKQVRDWLFVDDHVTALWAALQQGRNGETYVIGGNNELTNREVVSAILAEVEVQTGKPSASQVTFVADRPGHDFRYAIDPTKIRTELGWSPAETFESGLARTVRWYLESPEWVEGVRSGAYREWMTKHYGVHA